MKSEKCDTSEGIFISLEGGDGSGKSTQATLLGQWCGEATGREVILTREPGGTALGAQLRQLVQHGEDMAPRTEALLYAADRAHHVAALIRPALERGAVVITDRYLDSSVAYQSGGRELGAQEIKDLSLWATDSLLPDVTVLLDIDEATADARRHAREAAQGEEPDRLERAGQEFHARVRSAYRALAQDDPARWLVIDASGTVEEVHAALVSALIPRLASHLPASPSAGDPADAHAQAITPDSAIATASGATTALAATADLAHPDPTATLGPAS